MERAEEANLISLTSFRLYTDQPHVLEIFLSDILGLEIGPGEDLFSVQLSEFTVIQVYLGSSLPQAVAFKLSTNFSELLQRMEFFKFRFPYLSEISFSATDGHFLTPDGHKWSVIETLSFHGCENSSTYVRNC
jgi:hypothetical protein